ncbi:reverse transcriptase domain, Reverse transcriptase zinc-binding domain protein [Artemisia annua]|uniref:Reverse transcriptase domain, Reverse transcriptase zinc-binding domain protein n=1 Tax=Artemisia annua TaxID=35608 RepID=A0A2U1NUW6_ARTAN|nr:reverse transcriptase domain, Reverse transcriptase zinc-binding domain protein [Artemisia annua]
MTKAQCKAQASKILNHYSPSRESCLYNCTDDGWPWPWDSYNRFPILNQIMVPNLVLDRDDSLVWKDLHGNARDFSVHEVWEARYSKTLGRRCCNKLKYVPMSVLQVWNMVRVMAAMDDVASAWEDIIVWIKPLAAKCTARSIIARLVVAATAYSRSLLQVKEVYCSRLCSTPGLESISRLCSTQCLEIIVSVN